jgi:hypothetical protein
MQQRLLQLVVVGCGGFAFEELLAHHVCNSFRWVHSSCSDFLVEIEDFRDSV